MINLIFTLDNSFPQIYVQCTLQKLKFKQLRSDHFFKKAD